METDDVSENGLSNHYLFDLLSKRLNIDAFAGVYAADTIPKSLLYSKGQPLLCIVNTAKLAEKGRHFITILIKKNGITIFDSLAFNLEKEAQTLYKIIKNCNKTIKNAFYRPLQGKDSIMCGIYCAYFCIYISKREFPQRKGMKELQYGKRKENDRNVVKNVIGLIKQNSVQKL